MEAAMEQISFDDLLSKARYEGPVDPVIDFDRLQAQTREIYILMSDGEWRTLAEIEDRTGFPQASISAQLRHLRKQRFGSHNVEKQRRKDLAVWEYRIRGRR
jgi:hypothetical protein